MVPKYMVWSGDRLALASSSSDRRIGSDDVADTVDRTDETAPVTNVGHWSTTPLRATRLASTHLLPPTSSDDQDRGRARESSFPLRAYQSRQAARTARARTRGNRRAQPWTPVNNRWNLSVAMCPRVSARGSFFCAPGARGQSWAAIAVGARARALRCPGRDRHGRPRPRRPSSPSGASSV